jgi:hypothetical protein
MNHPNVSEPVYTLQATGDSRCFAGYGRGLFASDNGGITWKYAYQSLLGDAPLPTVSLLHVNGVSSPAFLAQYSARKMAAANGRLLGCLTPNRWWLRSPRLLILRRTALIFAGTAEDGVFISSDQGESWAVWNFGLLDPNVLSLAVTLTPKGCSPGSAVACSAARTEAARGARSCCPVGMTQCSPSACPPCFRSHDGVGIPGYRRAWRFKNLRWRTDLGTETEHRSGWTGQQPCKGAVC